MKKSMLVLSLVLFITGCGKLESEIIENLTANDSKSWILETEIVYPITYNFDTLSTKFPDVKYCGDDDLYTFKSTGELEYSNASTEYISDEPYLPFSVCYDTLIQASYNWTLVNVTLLDIHSVEYEIIRITDSTMLLSTSLGKIAPYGDQDSIPVYCEKYFVAAE